MRFDALKSLTSFGDGAFRWKMARSSAATFVASGLMLAAEPLCAQDLQGHGGPIGALDVNGGQVLSGAFDTRAILWDGDRATALRVMRFHQGSVEAVAFLPDDHLATAGQDGRVAIWAPSGTQPRHSTELHRAPVSSLGLSPDGERLFVSSWDGQLQVITIADGEATATEAHGDRIAGMGVLPDGRIVSVGADLRYNLWSPDLDRLAGVTLPAPPNGLAITDDGVAVAFADGWLRLFSPEGQMRMERELSEHPLSAVTADGAVVAAAALGGVAWVLEGPELNERYSVETGQGQVWALALTQESLMTGGADGLIRRWDVAAGTPLGEGAAAETEAYDDGSRGAEVWRACAICHSLSPGSEDRAGPSLHGVFGRRIATLPDYDYSPALQEMDIVWTPETVAELFEHGPEAYTPGSRMPEQRLSNPEDRAALVEFLERMAH